MSGFATDAAAWPPLPASAAAATRWADVDTAALSANTAAIVARVGPDVAVMAMVKANGYGHGLGLAAEAAVAGGAAWLGVATAEEAFQLRRLGRDEPILVVGWTPSESWPDLIGSGVDLTVYTEEMVATAAAAARAAGRPARVQVKVDSGMGRIGVRWDAADPLLASLRHSRGDVGVTGVFTQLADADGDDPDFTLVQHERFVAVAARMSDLAPEALLHCCNSAALLRFPELHHDMVRPGIALYGYPPRGVLGAPSLTPALSLRARITQVKQVQPGDSVGYGRSWIAERPTPIATASIGYGDGIFRAQGNRGEVLVSGAHCPIVGRVSMDQIGIDVSAAPHARAGEVVTIIGRDGDGFLGADVVAAAAGTISYEVLTAISGRVPRLPV